MNDELRLGFHRIGRRFEDPTELFALAGGLWALAAMMIALALALSFTAWLLLTAGGVAGLFLVRDRIADLAQRWRSDRVELEHRHSGQLAHSD